MTCETMLEQMSAALDGELTADEKAQLDRHLAQCDHCRALYDQLTALHEACGGLEVAPPPALKVNVLQNLPAQESPAKVIWVHWKRWAAMAAAFVLVSLAAWNLPKTGSSDPQVTPEQAAITQHDALTEAAGAISAPADIAGVANDQHDEAPTVVSEDISDLGSAADLSPAPTPSPDFFNGEPVNVNAAAPTATQYGGDGAAQKKMALSGYESASMEAATEYTAYRGTGDSAYFDKDAAEDASASDEVLPMLYAARMASPSPAAAPNEQPAPANGFLDPSAILDDDTRLEPHPEIEAEENVPATLFKSAVTEEADPLYCGVLTLPNGNFLSNYPVQLQANREAWYELPCAAFYALVEELTSGGVSLDLRTTGDDVSPASDLGLVVILP